MDVPKGHSGDCKVSVAYNEVWPDKLTAISCNHSYQNKEGSLVVPRTLTMGEHKICIDCMVEIMRRNV